MIDATTLHTAKPARPLPMSRRGLIEQMLAPVVFDSRPLRRSRIDAALKIIGEGPAHDSELDGVLAGLQARRRAGGGSGRMGPSRPDKGSRG
ncbi:MAG: hypothetical protein OJK14_02835 [Achromobacter sp.]|uniref:hypothetical protein n=1 Tax=Achromobacter sp. TaxID=134375 RepID=UPI00258279C8|nr:hypothetical protein [Achromobacter sp.]MCW0206004.1 hypothetical protein [Achromobacter sp.]